MEWIHESCALQYCIWWILKLHHLNIFWTKKMHHLSRKLFLGHISSWNPIRSITKAGSASARQLALSCSLSPVGENSRLTENFDYMFALVSYTSSSFRTDASGRHISEQTYTITGDTLGVTCAVKPLNMHGLISFFLFVVVVLQHFVPLLWQVRSGCGGVQGGSGDGGGLFHACAAGIGKPGSNLKINCEYLLGATFACDTLSCVPSQFTGTARVCHSSLS